MKLEICAKEDNLELYRKLIQSNDLNEDSFYNLLNKVCEAESVNIFKQILVDYSNNVFDAWVNEPTSQQEKENRFNKYLKMLLLSNKLFEVKQFIYQDNSITDVFKIIHKKYKNDMGLDSEIEILNLEVFYNRPKVIDILKGAKRLTEKDYFMQDTVLEILDDDFYKAIMLDKRVDDITRNKFFDENNELYFLYYPYLIDLAYKLNKKEIFLDLTQRLYKKLKPLKDAYENDKADRYKRYKIVDWRRKPYYLINEKVYSYTYIMKKTLKTALAKSDYENLKCMNSINYLLNETPACLKNSLVISEIEIEHHKIKLQKNLDLMEKKIKLATYGNIVDIEKILTIDDYSVYKNVLSNYPASKSEFVYNLIDSKDYRSLFDYFSNHDRNEDILDCFRTKNFDNIEKLVSEHFSSVIKFENKRYRKVVGILTKNTNKISEDVVLKYKKHILLSDLIKKNKDINLFKIAIEKASDKEKAIALQYMLKNRPKEQQIISMLKEAK